MSENQNCPCEAVKKLQVIVEGHEKQLAEGNTNFAVVTLKLDNIEAKLDKKDKFNSGIVTTIINCVLGLPLTYLAIRAGLQ